MLKVRPAQIGDADELAPRLREADLQEIEAASGEKPSVVLEWGIAWSEPCYTVVDEKGKPVALFGVVPDSQLAHVGIVWLLGSGDLVRHSFTFLRNCRAWVEKLQQGYKVLWNRVDARNETHIRWLRWCDFTFLSRIEKYGVEQRPFYEFIKVRNGEMAEPLMDTGVWVFTRLACGEERGACETRGILLRK